MLRSASFSIADAEGGLAARNREVLLAAGKEAKERVVEREFERIRDTVRKDLEEFLFTRLPKGDVVRQAV